MANMVEVDGLTKQYAGAAAPAVQEIRFAIRRGEVFSLLGPNGAGKTTTISMLSGLLEPTQGDARVGGHSIRAEPLAVKRALGVVPQEIALYPTLTARENLYFWGRMYGLNGAALKARSDHVLEVVGLEGREKERVEAYSGGMKRRLNIAVGLLHEPQLMLMDEPTVGIDPQSRRRILETIKALNKQGLTVLYTTHYMEEAQEISDRIGIIDHGRLIALGSLDELTALVGHRATVRIGLGDSPPPGLLPALESLPGVDQVAAENGTIQLLTSNGDAALPELIAQTNAHQARVTSVSIEEPNLEAVFLHLTGRALRD